ncbi:hypothetical protein Ddye_024641 [Dipteronia dyeriana]|uniref:Myb/SANT-like domain-containing protein n=1 Tax=Dipteronia dyeriana TaxID=168575 RepID=A0AAD9TW84_9ROSI|nr:hypothetical protein Ddye_024641 [Dipteronia dyeriana]
MKKSRRLRAYLGKLLKGSKALLRVQICLDKITKELLELRSSSNGSINIGASEMASGKHARKQMANEGAQGKAKAVWDPPTHEIWVDLAIEQVRAGNRNGTHLSKQCWKNFIENFNKITGRTYDRKQLKNHWDNVKKEWQLWDSLVRGETGLGWDMERQTIDASNEWWEAKLQVAFMIDDNVSLDSEEAVHEDEVECCNRKQKTLAPNRKKFKKGKKKTIHILEVIQAT